ncbi:MAG: NAD(P)-dependent oxidoreductase, partial [Bacteroidia bacterium]
MKILLIDVFQNKTIEALAQLPNAEVLYLPEIQRDEILLLIEDVNVLILNSKTQIDNALIDRAKALHLVIRAGVGLDHFDLPYLAEKNILACNTAGANADSVGEQTVGMLLALHHQLMKANAEVKRFEWIREPNRALEIKGKTVGIVGYGNTGKSVAKKLSGFDCQVLAYDKYKENYGDKFAQAVSMETIFEQADILTLHIPLTAETHHLASFSFFERFAKSLTFLNLS